MFQSVYIELYEERECVANNDRRLLLPMTLSDLKQVMQTPKERKRTQRHNINQHIKHYIYIPLVL